LVAAAMSVRVGSQCRSAGEAMDRRTTIRLVGMRHRNVAGRAIPMGLCPSRSPLRQEPGLDLLVIR